MTGAKDISLEICANSLESAINAQLGRAHRIELCQNLEQGGTTPSYGLIKEVKMRLHIPVHVLIRPRAGDFVYNDGEISVMLEDIKMCKGLGCEGVVVGVLTPEHQVDIEKTRLLVDAAHPMHVTFHRAFDDIQDPEKALDDVIETGCNRILTCGGAQSDSATHGRAILRKLHDKAGGRVYIMPGSGVDRNNLMPIVRETGVYEVHASATEDVPLEDTTSRFYVRRRQTSVDKVKGLVSMLETMSTGGDSDHLYMTGPKKAKKSSTLSLSSRNETTSKQRPKTMMSEVVSKVGESASE